MQKFLLSLLKFCKKCQDKTNSRGSFCCYQFLQLPDKNYCYKFRQLKTMTHMLASGSRGQESAHRGWVLCSGSYQAEFKLLISSQAAVLTWAQVFFKCTGLWQSSLPAVVGIGVPAMPVNCQLVPHSVSRGFWSQQFNMGVCFLFRPAKTSFLSQPEKTFCL